MARPIKQGLEYFPVDVDMWEDDKFQLTLAKHGPTAERVILRLLMSLYRVGYCYRWEPRDRMIFASKLGLEIAIVEAIVSDLIEDGFFDKRLLENCGVLSSKGIQKRFKEATRKRVTGAGIVDEEHDLTEGFRAGNYSSRGVSAPKTLVSAEKTPEIDTDIRDTEEQENLSEINQIKTEFPEIGVSAEKTRVSAPETTVERGFPASLVHKGKERKGKEIKGKERKEDQELTLPDWILTDSGVLELLETWISQRAHARKKVSQEALDLNLKKFSGRPEVLKVALENSIRCDWQGLFEPNPKDLKANGVGQISNHQKNLDLTQKLKEMEDLSNA